MGVYFEPRGRSWLDYVAPIAQEALGGMIRQGFEKNREIRAAKQTQEAAAADELRKRQQAEWTLQQLGYAPGSLDMRGDPNGAMAQLAAIKSLVPGFEMGDAMKSLNPNMQFQAIDRGDRITAGGFDPNSGAFNSTDLGVGLNPTQKYAQDAATARTRMAEGGATARNQANVDLGRARLEAEKNKADLIQFQNGLFGFSNPYAQTITPTDFVGPDPAGGKGSPRLQMKVIEDGTLALFNPVTGDIIPTPYKAPQKGGGDFETMLQMMLGQGVPPNQPPQPGQPLQPQLAPKPQAAMPGAPSESEAMVLQMMQMTGKPREEVVKFLMGRGLLGAGL